MKTTRRVFAVALAMFFFVGLAQAQIQFYIVQKQQNYVQTSASTPSLDATNPYRFSFEINGSGLSGLTPSTLTVHPAAGSGSSSYTMVAGDYDSMDDSWKYHSNFLLKSDLDTAFNNGTYTVDISGTNGIALKMDATPTGDLYPSVTPQITGMTNGAFWNGSGQLQINPTLGTTLTFADFTQYNSTANGQIGGHIGADFFSTSVTFTDINHEAFTFSSDPSFNTFVINPLSAGTYQFEMEFNVLTGVDTTSIAGATGVGLFTSRLQFAVVAIPEPSTYAAMLGAVALVGAAIRRRWRATA